MPARKKRTRRGVGTDDRNERDEDEEGLPPGGKEGAGGVDPAAGEDAGEDAGAPGEGARPVSPGRDDVEEDVEEEEHEEERDRVRRRGKGAPAAASCEDAVAAGREPRALSAPNHHGRRLCCGGRPWSGRSLSYAAERTGRREGLSTPKSTPSRGCHGCPTGGHGRGRGRGRGRGFAGQENVTASEDGGDQNDRRQSETHQSGHRSRRSAPHHHHDHHGRDCHHHGHGCRRQSRRQSGRHRRHRGDRSGCQSCQGRCPSWPGDRVEDREGRSRCPRPCGWP